MAYNAGKRTATKANGKGRIAQGADARRRLFERLMKGPLLSFPLGGDFRLLLRGAICLVLVGFVAIGCGHSPLA
jgi:hypothetical protein